MEIIGKVKNIVAKTNNHLVFLEDKTMLSAFGSAKIEEGKTYKFQCTKNGIYVNYDKKNVVEVSEDGGLPGVLMTGKIVDHPRKSTPIAEMTPRVTKESTKTPESMEKMKKDQAKLNGPAFGMIFNNTILLLIDQGFGGNIPKHFDRFFQGLLILHEEKRKELGVQ